MSEAWLKCGMGGVLVAGLLVAPVVAASSAVAAGFPDNSPNPGVAWNFCQLPDEDYCIESASLAGTSVSTVGGDSTTPAVRVSILDRGREFTPASVNWAIQRPGSDIFWGFDEPGADTSIVLRVGSFTPRYTSAFSDGLNVSTETDGVGDAARTTLTITGKVTEVNWASYIGDPPVAQCTLEDCGDENLVGNDQGNIFSGNTQDMGTWGEEAISRFGGMYIATNAQTMAPTVGFEMVTPPESANSVPAWTYQVANPHLAADTSPASGSFTAFLPANYFSSTGITPVGSEFEAFRYDNGSETATAISGASTTLVAGGAKLRIPNLTYSNPRLEVRSVPRAVPPAAPAQSRSQSVKSPPKRLKRSKLATLAKTTNLNSRVTWKSQTPRVCSVLGGPRVKAGSRRGVCKLRATAPGRTGIRSFTKNFSLQVF